MRSETSGVLSSTSELTICLRSSGSATLAARAWSRCDDALRGFGVELLHAPMTPRRVLEAIYLKERAD